MYELENEQDFEEVLQDGLRELIAQDGDYRTAEDMCWENLRVQTFAQELGVRGSVSAKKLAQRVAALQR